MIIALIVEILILVLLLKYTLKQKLGEPFSKKSMERFLIYGPVTGVILIVLMIVSPVDPHMFFSMHPIAAGLITALLLAAVPEEIVKYVLFRLAVRNNKEIRTVHDVIIVSVVIAFGFALLEDIQYTFFDGGTAILRALFPIHLLFQIAMGYFYGRGKAENKTAFSILALAGPILMHTVYDFPLITLKVCLGNIDTTNASAEEIVAMPYYNLALSIFVLAIAVSGIITVGMIKAFVDLRRKRESAVMQEMINPASEIYNL